MSSRLHRAALLSSIAEGEERDSAKNWKNLQDNEPNTNAVSPISSIVRDLENSTLLGYGCSKRKSDQPFIDDPDSTEDQSRTTGEDRRGLFKNAFKIRSTPETAVKSRAKARRLLGMESRRFTSPEVVSPSIDKENGSLTCSPLNSSPQKIPCTKKSRYPLEDCDPNSQDSGYGASYMERDAKSGEGFRFAEPMAVAPRRMSFEPRSPMESPIRCSPPSSNSAGGNRRVRTSRPSIFRSLSSGYESMDDGFNDLIDIDSMDDTTQLPNGISTLLSGDIVADSLECSPAPETTRTSFPTSSTRSLTAVAPAATTAEVVADPSYATTPEFSRGRCKKANFRRSISLRENERYQKSPSSGGGATTLSKVRSCLFRSPSASSSTAKLTFEDDVRRGCTSVSYTTLLDTSPAKTFKRPDPPVGDSPKLAKRSRRSSSFADITDAIPSSKQSLPSAPTTLQRSLSETETHAHIKSAVHRSTTDSDLTGDFSKPCILPLAAGQHEDLKSISSETLASLIRGEFNDRISSFKIVDCRYPYEFDGGHIRDAVNLYSKDLVEQMLLDPLKNTPKIQPDSDKRDVLVFHCEFSWERGPNLSRFLRNIDRQRNKEHYPALHYPEVYLLHGGYEQFYREQRELCAPQGYRPMRHPDHEADLKQFRSKSKSWQGEKSRHALLTTRTNLKRLGF